MKKSIKGKFSLNYTYRFIGRKDEYFKEKFVLIMGDYYFFSPGWNVIYVKYRRNDRYTLLANQNYTIKPTCNTPEMWDNIIMKYFLSVSMDIQTEEF